MTMAQISSLRLRKLHGTAYEPYVRGSSRWVLTRQTNPRYGVWMTLEREYDEVDARERADLRDLVRDFGTRLGWR